MRVAAVAVHVLGRVDVHQERHQGHDQEHHHGRSVDQRSDRELDAARLEPGDGADHGQRRFGVSTTVTGLGVVTGFAVVDGHDRGMDLFTMVVVAVVNPCRGGQDRQHECDSD